MHIKNHSTINDICFDSSSDNDLHYIYTVHVLHNVHMLHVAVINIFTSPLYSLILLMLSSIHGFGFFKF